MVFCNYLVISVFVCFCFMYRKICILFNLKVVKYYEIIYSVKIRLFLKIRFEKFLMPIINFYLCKVYFHISTIEKRLGYRLFCLNKI